MTEKNNLNMANLLKTFIIVLALVFGSILVFQQIDKRKEWKQYLEDSYIDPVKGVSPVTRGVQIDTTKNDSINEIN